ncbi:FK506-binding protein 5 [Colossoma macropomum]|uniref:FK506-binding protein 5 n=1 Tax=Colossoma macropomum TaxID=42526 RepID=UPI00186456B4|nr:FK506-binding protein 5 [Colossoma macropomum]
MLSVSEIKQEEKPGESAESEEAAEPRGVKRKISLTRCDVCEAEDAKYRCPNCLKFSCSLSCVKQHKHESGCSGVRDKTAFVRLSQFSEINLLNDYRLLEETARVADKPNRDSLLHINPQHSTTVKLVRRNAAAAKVNLKILPKSFTRRKENTSIYIKVEQKLYWHLKLHFPQSSAQYTDRVPEDRLLEQILSDYVHPTESDPVKRQRLKLYVVSPPDQLCVFMKSEQRQPGSLRYHELDLKKSLRENLMFKTVVEYPELHVVLKERCQEYLTRFPERKSVVKSSDPKGSATTWGTSYLPVSSSRDDPEPPEGLKHPEKRRKCMADESELEEGEIRSEEEDEDEHVRSAGHAKEQKSTDRNPPHKDESSEDDDDDKDDDDDDEDQGGTISSQHATMKTDDPPSRDPGEEVKVQADAVATVTVETHHCLPHEGEEVEDRQVSTANDLNGTTKTNDPPAQPDHCEKNEDQISDQMVTMETADPVPHSHGELAGDEGLVHCDVDMVLAVNDPKVTMKTDLPPSSHDEDVKEDDDGGTAQDQNAAMETDHPPSRDRGQKNDDGQVEGTQNGANDQKVTMETSESSLRGPCEGSDEDRVDGGVDRAVSTNDEDVTVETDRNLHFDNGGDEDGDEGEVDGADNTDVAIDQKVAMETNSPLPHSHDKQGGDEGHHGGVDCASALNDQKVTMVTNSPLPHSHDKQGGDEGQVHCGVDSVPALNDQKVTVETDCLPSSAHDQNTDRDCGDDGH